MCYFRDFKIYSDYIYTSARWWILTQVVNAVSFDVHREVVIGVINGLADDYTSIFNLHYTNLHHHAWKCVILLPTTKSYQINSHIFVSYHWQKRHSHSYSIPRNMQSLHFVFIFSTDWWFPYPLAYVRGTGAIVRLPQCLWSNPKGYG